MLKVKFIQTVHSIKIHGLVSSTKKKWGLQLLFVNMLFTWASSKVNHWGRLLIRCTHDFLKLLLYMTYVCVFAYVSAPEAIYNKWLDIVWYWPHLIDYTSSTAFIWQLLSVSLIYRCDLTIKVHCETNLVGVSYCCISCYFTVVVIWNSCK